MACPEHAGALGSFAAGILLVWLEGRGPSALYLRAFLIVGVLGGLTTYSALMLEGLVTRSPHSPSEHLPTEN